MKEVIKRLRNKVVELVQTLEVREKKEAAEKAAAELQAK